MKQYILLLVLGLMAVTSGAFASKEGILQMSNFRVESEGIGSSGRIVVEGKTNAQFQIAELKISAFGKDHVIPSEKLALLADFRANGMRLSYEAGYKELGGKTVYIQFQRGFTSGTQQEALLTLTESGKVDVRIKDAKPTK